MSTYAVEKITEYTISSLLFLHVDFWIITINGANPTLSLDGNDDKTRRLLLLLLLRAESFFVCIQIRIKIPIEHIPHCPFFFVILLKSTGGVGGCHAIRPKSRDYSSIFSVSSVQSISLSAYDAGVVCSGQMEITSLAGGLYVNRGTAAY